MPRVLVLYEHAEVRKMKAAIRAHLRSLELVFPPENLLYYNALNGAPAWLGKLQIDAIILHSTLLEQRWDAAYSKLKRSLDWVKTVDCLKIAIPQDEYDHAEVLDNWLYDWGVSVIFTNFSADDRALLYPSMHTRASFYECLTGYLDTSYREEPPPIAERPLDLVYRAKWLPYWFGSQGQLKSQIADVIQPHAEKLGLRCDISTLPQHQVHGAQWYQFLSSARAVIGCESGSSVLDKRGEIQSQIRAYLRQNPNGSF